MDLEKLRNKYLNSGYTMANALAKICQDIILSKIAKSSFKNNITIKGGVVMHNISKNKRRATRDLDIDFIKYSLNNDSINDFIKKLNNTDNDIKIIVDDISELQHQDYKGKRVKLKIIDKNNFAIYSKLDIGVHKLFDINQDEYCFNLEAIDESVTLFINSKEQIIGEKLKSLLKLGIISTRFKDIFDFYYLINYTNLNKDELLKVLQKIIISDKSMKENNIEDIVKRLKDIFSDKRFISNLDDAKNNWLEIPVEIVVENILNYFSTLQYIS